MQNKKPRYIDRGLYFFEWSQRPDSDRRPAHYECAALPTELRWPQKNGGPNEIRTRVAALKGRCPRPLDDGTAKW